MQKAQWEAELDKSAAWAEQMQAEYHKTRERARSLMAERDAEVQALKARLRAAGGGDAEAHQALPQPQASPQKPPRQEQQRPSSAPEILPVSTSANSASEGPADLEGPKAAAEAASEAAPAASALEIPAPAPREGLKASVEAAEAQVGALLVLAEAQEPVEAAAVREVAAAVEAAARAAEAEEARLSELSAALEDSERTERLRDQTHALLKEEINELRRNAKAGEVDTVYLKNVIVAALENGEFSASQTSLHIIGRLLVFSPEEMERCSKGKGKGKASGKQGLTGGFSGFSIGGFTSGFTKPS